MASLFLSYRRHDSAGFAGRLADDLEAAFGADSVFRDVEDIQPGQDYVQTIDAELLQAQAVLVMIGPYWLAHECDGKRRIDAPDDVARHEIATALNAGKPIIPLLVGGAKMPAEADLPADVAGLARREAMELSDADWHRDVELLVTALRKWMPSSGPAKPLRRRIAVAASALAMAGIATIVWFAWPHATRQPAQAFNGRWTAQVKYDWGDQHDEVFEFKPLARDLHGTASYLGGRLAIEQAKLDGEWLSFTTRSLESLNDAAPKETLHRYIGQLESDGIHFTLETSGGYSIHPPVEFVARHQQGDGVAVAAREEKPK